MADAGCGTSETADAVHRVKYSPCRVLPAGEHVASITVRDALAEWNDDSAGYGVPCEIGHFSVQGERREYVDGACSPLYLHVPVPWGPFWNLDSGYENAQRRVREYMPPTHDLLRWVIRNKDKVVTPSSAWETQSPSTDFICDLQILKVLLSTPFQEKLPWQIVACRRGGLLYMYYAPMKGQQLLNNSRVLKKNRQRYWRRNFYYRLTTTEPGAAPEEDDVAGEGNSYNVVLRCQLGPHSIVLGADTKAVDISVQCDPGSTAGYVAMKTCGERKTTAQQMSFCRNTLLGMWALARLAGAPKVLCGFIDDDGILFSILNYDVSTIPEMAKGQWSEVIVMKFGQEMLSFIKEHVKENDERSVYLFEYVPSSREVVCKRLTDPGSRYGFPDWFLAGFEGC
ncbi:uncharacterized protein LOC119462446 [Dermacentor silvarum]|uniref:uncharacterized protein LOC119462446 n=1 Tax=Dermacentor silvarum TaxID=543639 RepID=UPI002101C5DB|nr:uncharacterized protein LOC119462446 [Dermacentor silvarum]